MSNTFSRVHIHIVFSVKYRQKNLHSSWRSDLFKVMTGLVKKQDHKLVAVNGVSDHVHLLIGFRPHQSIAELVREIKRGSSQWINAKGLTSGRFRWQEGYGVFSCSDRNISNVIKYIQDQERHHSDQSFRAEYRRMLGNTISGDDFHWYYRDPE